MPSHSTWLITGCSCGFGLSLTRTLLSHNQNVIATSRNPSKTPALVQEITSNPRARWLPLDVTAPKSEIDAAIQSAWKEFGSIDVLVNNAGCSILGAAEDIPEESARGQFEVNFWGVVRATQAVLPLMRARKRGTVVNMTSIAGLDALPSCAMYAASKFAVEAWSESLSKEIAPLGLRVLIVEPGAFRTRFLSEETSPHVPLSEGYRGGPVEGVLRKFEGMREAQDGDPEKAGRAIWEAVEGVGGGAGREGLLRLPLGPDCFERGTAALRGRLENLEALRDVALSTNFG